MKKYILIVILFLFAIKVDAQQAQNIADLDFLYQAIQQTPSYKDQLKGDKKYQQVYESIKSNFNDQNEFDVYRKLYRLIGPIKDNHLGFYKIADTTLKPNLLKLNINVDSLKNSLKDNSITNIEGIYNTGDKQVAIFSKNQEEKYVFHLESKTVVGFLIKTPHQSLDYISLQNSNRGFVLLRNLKFTNGNFRILNLYRTEKPIFNNLEVGKENFEFKHLADGVDYLRLSSFYSSNVNIAIATKFFVSVKDSIHAPHLIVDVRNNSGGGFRTSQQFISFLSRYKGMIYILQNEKTASNAEKFIVRLIGKKNVLTLGETSLGTLTYGSNYGKTLSLPNHKFYFYPTDSSDKIDFKYENVGIVPQVILNPFTEDWISQTLKYIKAND